VYASTREAELAVVPWTEQEKAEFLNSQFDAQRHHYETYYAGATFEVIEVEGAPAGRLYLRQDDADVRVMDIALLPAYRNRGLGALLLRSIVTRAHLAGRTVSVHVEVENPARALYERLGFEPVEQRGIYLFMVARPAQRNSSQIPEEVADGAS
jgi:ribosomal protein S18 acetylase RimI-like enzyme